MDHINSYSRESLGNKCPYELFEFLYGADLLHALGCHRIPPNEVDLTPALLNRQKQKSRKAGDWHRHSLSSDKPNVKGHASPSPLNNQPRPSPIKSNAETGVAFTLIKKQANLTSGIVRPFLRLFVVDYSYFTRNRHKKQPYFTFWAKQSCMSCIYFNKVALTLKFNKFKYFVD